MPLKSPAKVAPTLIGLTEEEAETVLFKADLKYRYLSFDGLPTKAKTNEYASRRVSLRIEQGKVVAAIAG